jgi:type IV pilus assembly protein PilA
MMRRIRHRLASERGFTLLEVLVVMLILGILASIGYAVFLGQRTKANDATAKDAASALNVDVASCFVETEDYSRCKTEAQLTERSLKIDNVIPADACADDPPSATYPPVEAGKVAVIAASKDCYVIQATSFDNHAFWQIKRPGVTVVRTCEPRGQGGCTTDGFWNRS